MDGRRNSAREQQPAQSRSILRRKSQLGLFAALLCAGSMWFYVQRILIPYEKADAAAHQRPRGNLSDLYPRWLGTRELLLHHRNPYSPEITAEIQRGYYGRELDVSRPDDPKDQQGFAYPVYVIFLLGPFAGFSFHQVQFVFYWLLVVLTAASVLFWARALGWRLPPAGIAISLLLTLGSFPVVQGIKLEQLSLLVAGLLAGSAACVAAGYLSWAGALLALATIKPQLAWPMVIWLMVWAGSDWRARGRLVISFVSVMALLLGGAELVMPGWWRMFLVGLGQYHQYTHNRPVLEILAGPILGRRAVQILEVGAGLFCGIEVWKKRREPAGTPGFGHALAVVLAFTVLVVPMYAPYNQVLLLPAILWLVRERRRWTEGPVAAILIGAAAVLVFAWSWIATLTLSLACFVLSTAVAQNWWKLPFYSTFALPVLIFALVLFERSEKRVALRGQESAE
jgi:hypothetical protein